MLRWRKGFRSVHFIYLPVRASPFVIPKSVLREVMLDWVSKVEAKFLLACVCVCVGNHFEVLGGIINGKITLHNFLLCTKTCIFKTKNIFHTFGYNTWCYLFKFYFTEGRKEWGKEEKVFVPKLLSSLKRGYYCNFIFKLLAVPISVCYDLLRLH